MNKAVTDVITSFKPRTIKTLKDQQSANTPYIDPNFIEKQVTEYVYSTHRRLVNPNHEACFRCRYMYLKYMPPRKYIHFAISRESIFYLIENNVIDPFLLFINNRLVPWRMIDIVMTHEEYFIICKTEDPSWLNRFKHVESIDVVHLNDGCIYLDYPIEDISHRIFGFEVDGTFSDRPDCPISILDNSFNMYFKNFHYEDAINAVKVSNDRNVKHFSNNVILFKNKLLDTTTPIDFKSTLITINNGVNDTNDVYDFTIFGDLRSRSTLDNIKNANLDFIKPFIEKQNLGQEIPQWIIDIEKQFDFAMSRKKDYATNVAETIDYIIKYNASLFEDAYLANSNLSIEEKTGKWVIDNTRPDGTLMIPREHGEFTDEFILMLVNGILYKFYYMAKYTPDYYIVPIKDIDPEDSVVIMRFKNVNNNTFDIVINENDSFHDYDNNYINDQMMIFSTIPSENHYTFPIDGLQHFPVDFTIEKDENGLRRIRYKDPKYYGTKAKVVYKNQFRHYWYNIDTPQEAPNFRIDLGTKFMYCNDYHRYMVFLNGRRLNTDQYRLCLPVREGTPYSRFELYLTMNVGQGDRVDVVYTPSLLKDIVLIKDISPDGKIEVEKPSITYGLTKNLYILWANGKMIPKSKISNIDSTHIRITEDIETLSYLSITKFLPDIDDLTEVFQASIPLWDHIISQLTDDEIKHLLDIVGVDITNIETGIYDNTIDVRSVMLELIRDKYVFGANVDTTKPFAYDYVDVDTTAIEGFDSSNNATLIGGDANIAENIDGIKRYQP